MYVKTTTRQSKAGPVRYLHLAHSERDAGKGRSVPRILYSFGREDQLDKDAIRRLVASLGRLLDPGGALAAATDAGLAFTGSRPCGGACVLDQLWQRLGIGVVLAGLAAGGPGRPRDVQAAERVLFGLVANRALAPASKLAACEWMSADVHIDGLAEVSDDACYRATGWLHAVRGELEEQVYFQVADLLNLEVDLLFSTRPRRTSSWRTPTARCSGTGAASPPPAGRRRTRTGKAGSARTASRRTAVMTCRRSSSGWRSPARRSRSGSGAGPGTPPTRH
jgi:hypothetical protein